MKIIGYYYCGPVDIIIFIKTRQKDFPLDLEVSTYMYISAYIFYLRGITHQNRHTAGMSIKLILAKWKMVVGVVVKRV